MSYDLAKYKPRMDSLIRGLRIDGAISDIDVAIWQSFMDAAMSTITCVMCDNGDGHLRHTCPRDPNG